MIQKVFPMAMNRADAVLLQKDIDDAVADFPGAAVLTLNTQYQGKFDLSRFDGLEVRYSGGCLGWELWLSNGKTEEPNLLSASSPASSRACDIIATPEIVQSKISVPKKKQVKRGRPSILLPLDIELIKILSSSGLSIRKIEAELRGKLAKLVSYRTIARVLKKAKA